MEAESLDLFLAEAQERSLTLAFTAPRGPGGWTSRLRGGGPAVDFEVTIVGGPNGDIRGPRVELGTAAPPARNIKYEVSGLQPDTMYTVSVALCARPGEAPVGAELEVRTAAPPDAQLGDGGGASAKKAGATKKDGKAGGADARAVFAIGADGAPLSTDLVEDDTSTMAPSDDADDAAMDEFPSDTPAPAPPRQPSTDTQEENLARTDVRAAEAPEERREVGTVPEVELEGPMVAPTPQCNICSLFNICLKKSDSTPKPKPAKRTWRPYRPPFPGTPVDPASVGLPHLAPSGTIPPSL